MNSKLFSPFKIREVELRNRIAVSPMCQYSCLEGMPTDWHLVHLGSRAVGGAGLVIVEATAVSPEGRISPEDMGIWNDDQAAAHQRIASFISDQGAIPGIQLAHAGRKASTYAPWRGSGEVKKSNGGWQTVAPSPIPFSDDYPKPRELQPSDLDELVDQFVGAAQRAFRAGFKVLELHMAHGYLLHEFLSPLSNHRHDEFGGNLDGRMRFPCRVAEAVRKSWPAALPMFVRISATDWSDGGWDLDQSIVFTKRLKELGVDLIDCSSGGLVHNAKVPVKPGYQVPFAAAIRREAKIATGAVGVITEPQQAEDILAREEADLIIMARAMLRDPYWPLHAARALSVDVQWPDQYLRAKQ